MLDKIKVSLNWSIILIFIIALIYFIVISIMNMFSPNSNSKSTNINQDNVNIYVSDNKIVKDYTTFFNVEKIIQSIILNLNKGYYKDIYSVISFEGQKNIGEDFYMKHIAEYVNSNFKYSLDDDIDEVGYKNYNNLKILYSMDNSEYIAVVNSTNIKKETKIGIKLVNNNKYLITYIEL